jgi:hypothetical protein
MGYFIVIPAAQFWHKNTQNCAAGIVEISLPCMSAAPMLSLNNQGVCCTSAKSTH